MARKHRRRTIYFNNNADTTTNDSNEQIYLVPTGVSTDSVDSREARKQTEEANVEFHDELEEHNTDLITTAGENDMAENEYSYSTGKRKYRRYMSKEVQTPEVAKLASEALDRHIPKRDFEDELHDDGIDAKNYPKEALVDYRDELAKKELPVKDKDKDGDIDKDDAEITPAMSKMARYM